MYAYCNGNPVMFIDPSGMVSVAQQLATGMTLGLLLAPVVWAQSSLLKWSDKRILEFWDSYLGDNSDMNVIAFIGFLDDITSILDSEDFGVAKGLKYEIYLSDKTCQKIGEIMPDTGFWAGLLGAVVGAMIGAKMGATGATVGGVIGYIIGGSPSYFADKMAVMNKGNGIVITVNTLFSPISIVPGVGYTIKSR
jgi:hypothetical protein